MYRRHWFRKPWFHGTFRLGAVALAVALVAGVSVCLAGKPAWPLPQDRPLVAAEEATPDCDAEDVDPTPAGQQREQVLHRLGVQRWHTAGYRGHGMKIAVLDTGFRGYQAHLGGALPQHVTVHSFRADGNLEARGSQHGILCAEVVHTLAPDAELLLANWDSNRPERFLEAIHWARQQGAHIVTCSVIMPTWSDGEGGGPVNQALARIVGSGDRRDDLLCFASAGNTAKRHWSGPFHDAGHGYHDWLPGQTSNLLHPWMQGDVSVELYGRAGAAYELIVAEAYTGIEVGRSLTRSDGERCAAVVHFPPQPLGAYSVQVRLIAGRQESFHLVALGGSLSCSMAQGSIPFPADSASVLAVAAVTRAGRRAAYSSCGPNPHCPKPDFAATVPFPSVWRTRPFTGTSAAAPQAAALAALCWSRHPGWTASQVRSILLHSAHDLGSPGHDIETGHGLIALPDEESN